MTITKEQLIEVVLGILEKDQMKELISRLEDLEKSSSPTEETPVPLPKKRAVESDFTMNRDDGNGKKRSIPVIAGKNQWKDDGEERDDFEDKVVRRVTPRNRPKSEMKTVICSVCNKPKEVSPGAVGNGTYYRCENCVGGGR